MDVAHERVEGVLRVELQAGLRHVARAGAGATGSPSSGSSSARTWPRSGAIRRRRSRDVSQQALGSVSRAFVDPERRKIYAGLNYPGTVGYIGAIGARRRARSRQLHDIKQPRIYTVTSLAYDPATRTLFYTADNTAYRDLMALDVDDAGGSGRCSRTRASATSRSTRPTDRSGASAYLNGICTLVRIPHPVHGLERGRIRGRTAKRSTTSTSRPTASCCRRRSARSAAARPCA